ncbi:MAG: Uma2 family endonuclease [Chloroflexi bacterium]|nr:Uma2 family endonuclease [Chloroflexota bacterium]
MLERAGEQGRLIELIDGEVIEKVVTELHGIIVLLLGYHLLKYREDKPDIRVSTEVHHRAPDGGPNVYQPDIAVTLLTNALPVQDRGAVPRMPDLAIEVWSPTNSLVSLRKKAEYYLAHGTQMVWIVNPKKRLIDVYRAGRRRRDPHRHRHARRRRPAAGVLAVRRRVIRLRAVAGTSAPRDRSP